MLAPEDARRAREALGEIVAMIGDGKLDASPDLYGFIAGAVAALDSLDFDRF
jgi:hypothetical protein